MGVEIYTNKQDTNGVLVCNTEDKPVPGFSFGDSDAYDELRSENHYVPASAMGEAFLKYMRETFSDPDPRGMDLWKLKDRFQIFLKATNLEEI